MDSNEVQGKYSQANSSNLESNRASTVNSTTVNLSTANSLPVNLRFVAMLAFAGSFFYWLALPPFKFPLASFLACICWSGLVFVPQNLGRRGYWTIYAAGCLVWLALLQGIRLAYWPLYGGWVALSVYVAVYLPFFVGSARLLHHKYFISLPFACAISWTGGELIRSYFATGFSACMLGHSMTPWPVMLNVASHLGTFGVSFFIMLTGATFGSLLWRQLLLRGNASTLPTFYRDWGLYAAALISCGWFGYSFVNDTAHQKFLEEIKPVKALGRFLIVQGNMPTMFESNVDSLVASWAEYARMTRAAAAEVPHQDIDVILWPESTFDSGRPLPWSYFEWDKTTEVIPEWGIEGLELKMLADESLASKWSRLTPHSKLPISYLVGGGVLSLQDGKMRRYNTALWLSPSDEQSVLPTVDYYAKRHLVMFGEYIPFVSLFPGLLESIGMGTLDAGDRYVGWKTRSGCTIAPSVCFENVVPQLVQQQVQELTKQGNAPDLLVNVTNDAWFRGSSLLDHHLNNAISCAAENRKPMLVAANNGISAWIDSTGRIVKSLDRFEEGTLVAEPIPDGRWGLWQTVGDWPARFIALITLIPWFNMLATTLIRKSNLAGPKPS